MESGVGMEERMSLRVEGRVMTSEFRVGRGRPVPGVMSGLAGGVAIRVGGDPISTESKLMGAAVLIRVGVELDSAGIRGGKGGVVMRRALVDGESVGDARPFGPRVMRPSRFTVVVALEGRMGAVRTALVLGMLEVGIVEVRMALDGRTSRITLAHS